MEVEGPGACSAIQAATNSKGALRLLTHEMQACSKLRYLASGAISTDVEVIRLQLTRTSPQLAEDEHFLDACRFIVDVGSLEAPSVKDLMAFHQQFLDPKVRRARLGVHVIMSEHGLCFSHLKTAGVKHA